MASIVPHPGCARAALPLAARCQVCYHYCYSRLVARIRRDAPLVWCLRFHGVRAPLTALGEGRGRVGAFPGDTQPDGHAPRARWAHGDALCASGVGTRACDATVARSERRGRGPRSHTGLACTTRPSPRRCPCGRTPRHLTATKDTLDGHAPYRSALDLTHPPAIPAADE
jgi:hypothetical protein